MTTYGANTGVPQWSTSSGCGDPFGCSSTTCPDFIIKRHDTKPPFKVAIENCDGPLLEDLTDEELELLVAEASMWATAKLKSVITSSDTYFALANNYGFDQIMIGDVIQMDRVRRPEEMLVIGFDETNKFVQVLRGYNDTEAGSWPKGTGMKIFRVKDETAEVEIVREDITNVDGTTTEDVVTGSYLVYEWGANDTCLPGCYVLEFKLLQMLLLDIPSNISVSSIASLQVDALAVTSVIPSFTPSTLSIVDFGCALGTGVDWARRFPQVKDGFAIQVIDSPTAE